MKNKKMGKKSGEGGSRKGVVEIVIGRFVGCTCGEFYMQCR